MTRSSTMEDVVKQHNKTCCESLETLNLKNFNAYCDDQARVSNISEKIVELNKLGNVRFVFINGYKDYKRNLQILRGLKSSDKSNLHHVFKEELQRHMLCSSLLNHQRNALSIYLNHVKNQCENCNVLDIESLLVKYLTVCRLLPPVSGIKSSDEELEQYQNLAAILRRCHQINLSNSHIVAELLKMILNMHLVNSADEFRVRHENYDNGFLQYIVDHVENEGISLNDLLSRYSNTIWKFSNQFSILNALVDGDGDRMLFLVSSGVQIFPQHEQKKSGHNFPNIPQFLTRPQLIVLYIVERIRQKNLFDSKAIETVTGEQRKCFEIMWQTAPSTFLSAAETERFTQALDDEHKHLMSRGVEREKRESRRSKAIRLVKMYINNFYDDPEEGYKEVFINATHVCNMKL